MTRRGNSAWLPSVACSTHTGSSEGPFHGVPTRHPSTGPICGRGDLFSCLRSVVCSQPLCELCNTLLVSRPTHLCLDLAGLSLRPTRRGYNEPTVRRYALGEAEVPRIVELLLNVALYEPTAFAELVKARELPDDEL